jgi:hypothetical protein
MPKDKSEIQDQYKIEGGFINEYEFNQSKGEMEEQEHQTPEGGHVEGLRGADEPNAPQNVAERIREVEQRAHEIVERRRAKASGGAASKGGAGKVSMKQQNAENMAAGKAAKKAAKKSSKKSPAEAARKSSKKSAKKAAASKGSKTGAGKKGASKSAGKKSGGSKKGSAEKGGTKKGGASKKGSAKKGASKKGGRR